MSKSYSLIFIQWHYSQVEKRTFVNNSKTKNARLFIFDPIKLSQKEIREHTIHFFLCRVVTEILYYNIELGPICTNLDVANDNSRMTYLQHICSNILMPPYTAVMGGTYKSYRCWYQKHGQTVSCALRLTPYFYKAWQTFFAPFVVQSWRVKNCDKATTLITTA